MCGYILYGISERGARNAERKSMPMTPRQIDRWEKIRQKGLGRYIGIRGVLCFGLPLYGLLEMFRIIIQKGESSIRLSPLQSIADLVIVLVLVFCDGVIRWRLNEKAYAKYRGLCVRCGYDLTGNVSGVCPECGTGMPARSSSEARQRVE